MNPSHMYNFRKIGFYKTLRSFSPITILCRMMMMVQEIVYLFLQMDNVHLLVEWYEGLSILHTVYIVHKCGADHYLYNKS